MADFPAGLDCPSGGGRGAGHPQAVEGAGLAIAFTDPAEQLQGLAPIGYG
ncbi:hypothetical protein [Streptomyces sp. NPDC006668]